MSSSTSSSDSDSDYVMSSSDSDSEFYEYSERDKPSKKSNGPIYLEDISNEDKQMVRDKFAAGLSKVEVFLLLEHRVPGVKLNTFYRWVREKKFG